MALPDARLRCRGRDLDRRFAAFSIYTARFASYNKAWGSLAAVIVMLVWLWLTALALLFGAEVNAETERRKLPQAEAADSIAPRRERSGDAA